jgi:hypothetical protein
MNNSQRSSNLVFIFSVILIGFAIPHFVDDFLYGVPGVFGLSDVQGQVLGGLFFTLLSIAINLAARG